MLQAQYSVVCMSVGNVRVHCEKAKPIEMLFGRLTRVGPRKVAIPHEKRQFWMVVRLRTIKKYWESVRRCFVQQKKSITATAGLRQPAAMLQTGLCAHNIVPREKSSFCDAAFRQSSLTTYYWPAYTYCRGQKRNDRWRLSLSSVVCNTRICNVTHQGAARSGPVGLRTLGRHLV